MEIKRLNNEKDNIGKQYNDKVKELSEEMDKEIKSDKLYTEYISKIRANESSLSTNRNLTRMSKGNKSYVPQNQALESEIEELQDKIKSIENPIKEKYQKQIKDITDEYNSIIKQYNSKLSFIQYEEGDRERYRRVDRDKERVIRDKQEIEDAEKRDRIRRRDGEKKDINIQKELNKLGLPSNATQAEIYLRVSELDEKEFQNLKGTRDSVYWNIEYENYSRLNYDIKTYFISNYQWHLGISPRPNSDERDEILFKFFITQKVFKEHRQHEYNKSIIELEINRRIEMRNNYIKKIESERNIRNQEEVRKRQHVAENTLLQATKRDEEYKAFYEERKERERKIDKAREESENRENSTLSRISSYLFGKRDN
jgi:hypothetical protein